MKKIIAFITVMLIFTCILSGCGNDDVDEEDNVDTGSVYFLNFKPEAEAAYKKIAEDFTKETGIDINIVTAAAGGYEQTLSSEITKNDAPTIFQVNGPIGYKNWSDYCMNLKDTDFYNMLNDKGLAIKDEIGVYAVPYTVEGYGIIYNDKIMQKYFKSEDSIVESADEINSFKKFKEVVEDMSKKKNSLGIEGVFASTSMVSGDQWRWHTHLANMPFYYEFLDIGGEDNILSTGLDAETINFKYNEGYKNIFDLYNNNSITPSNLISGKTVIDSVTEFASGKVAMMQNGNWTWTQIAELGTNAVDENDVKMMPIYIGEEDEEELGLCVGTENYFAINDKASEADKKASLEFLEWLFSSETGKDYVCNELGFIAPFNTFSEDEKPSDPLGAEVIRWTEKNNIKSVPWVFTSFPSEEFKNRFGDALLQYSQGNYTWEQVKSTVIENWASEYRLTN